MENNLAFFRDRCCHRTFCLHMMEPHCVNKNGWSLRDRPLVVIASMAFQSVRQCVKSLRWFDFFCCFVAIVIYYNLLNLVWVGHNHKVCYLKLIFGRKWMIGVSGILWEKKIYLLFMKFLTSIAHNLKNVWNTDNWTKGCWLLGELRERRPLCYATSPPHPPGNKV